MKFKTNIKIMLPAMKTVKQQHSSVQKDTLQHDKFFSVFSKC